MGERCGDLAVVTVEPRVEVRKPQEPLELFAVARELQFSLCLNLSGIWSNLTLGEDVAEKKDKEDLGGVQWMDVTGGPMSH